MSRDFLIDIIKHKKEINKTREAFYQRLQRSLGDERYTRYNLFKKQISKPGKVNLIAEIKKASPSQGMIRENFDLLGIANIYEDNGAAAVSVLTEDKYFLGRPEYIKKVGEEINLPILTKDFILEEGQILEARYNGASAILLIVAILDLPTLKKLMLRAHALDLDCLVEVHDEKELEIALKIGAEMIGINNRNLQSFEVSMDVSRKLIPQIPKDKVIVAESGIRSNADIKELQQLGVHAVLIGETFMRSNDIAAKMKEVMHG